MKFPRSCENKYVNKIREKKILRLLNFKKILCILRQGKEGTKPALKNLKIYMKNHRTIVKVRYAETDQMGVVHHGNYAQYFEMARIDWLRELGISYKLMEKDGVMLPVYEMSTKFLKPAIFDDTLRIETFLLGKPGVKINFQYEVFNQENELLTTGSTVLVFMDSSSRKPIRCPENILEKLGY